MKYCLLIAGGLWVFLLTAQPLWASEIVEVGVFRVELLGPGDSAVGGDQYQFGNPFTITGTTQWSEEQKEALKRSLAVLNTSLVNTAGRPIRIAMAWRDDVDWLGGSIPTAFVDLDAGRASNTAEAAWRDGDAADRFPAAADILIMYNSEVPYNYNRGLPGMKNDLQSLITHEIVHGLGIMSAYDPEQGFQVLSRWDELIEDLSGNRPRAGTFGAPEPLPLIGPEGTLRWRGEHANTTYGGQMPIFTDEEIYMPGSTLSHPAPMGELMSWTGILSESFRAPNKLLLDVFRDLGWEINMDFYNAFGPTYYRNGATIENGADFFSDYDYAYALYVNGDGNHIVQSGLLESHGDFAETLRLAGNDNRLEIAGSLTAMGDDATVFYLVGKRNLVHATGYLQAHGDGSVGVYVAGGGNDLILSGATISADTAVHFTYSNRLVIQGDNRIEGDMIAEGQNSTMGFGYLVDEVGDPAGYDPNFSFRFDNDIVGNWLGYLGAGELSLNGDADFIALAIQDQGTLKGNATIHGALLNRGTVAPGNSIGILTIDGDYTQEAGAVLEVEAGAGVSDLLRVSGTADLQGGSLRLVPYGYLTGGSYTFLEAGILTGAFAELQTPAVFSAALDGSIANTLALAVTRHSYSILGANPDQKSLGTALDAMRPMATTDMTTILNGLDGLGLTDLRSAMTDLTPRFHSSVTAAALDEIHQRNDLLLERVGSRGAGMQRQRVWFSLLGDNARYDDEPESPAFRAKSRGIMLGLERRIGSDLRLGVAGAYDETDIDEVNEGSNADSLSWDAYLYGAWDKSAGKGGLYARALFGLGGDNYDGKRFIPFLSRTASSEHQGRHLSAALVGGYLLNAAGWGLSPRVGIEYIALHEDGFTEKGADTANLRLAAKDSETCFGLAGLLAERRFVLGNRVLGAQLGVDWVHAFSSDAESTAALFVDSGERFRIHGRERTADGLECNIGVQTSFANGITARIDYQRTLQGSGGYRASRIDLGLEWLF